MGKGALYLSFVLFACYLNSSNSFNASATSRLGEQNAYYVYNRDDPRTGVRIYPTLQSVNTFRNFRSKTVVIIHDHEGSGRTTPVLTIRDALLTNDDVTVISVDWSSVAAQNYNNAAAAASDIGANIAELIRLLVARNQVSLARLHIVGYGLGAHVAAFTARVFNGQVARITGLDPVSAQWGSNSERLQSRDAVYVEIIHTDTVGGDDSAAIGIAEPIGHVDFYPNGGTSHPGCNNEPECYHNRAWHFFAASLTHGGLIGNQCEEDPQSNDIDISAINCQGYTLPMGNNELVKYGSNVFYLETATIYPYVGAESCVMPCAVAPPVDPPTAAPTDAPTAAPTDAPSAFPVTDP